MGHERLGTLPKTQRWQRIVQEIGDFSISDDDVSHIADETIRNVHSRLRMIQCDQGVQAAFRALILLSIASRSSDPRGVLESKGILVPEEASPAALARAIRRLVAQHRESAEYADIGQSAAIDAIAIWHTQNRETQMGLFELSPAPFEVWRKASSGAGFCEISRLFFAKFTERYLNYFLEREASARLPDLREREHFRERIREHVNSISKHAFETARITQSFAAGWYNRYAAEGLPSDKAIEGFLSVAFGKIREELQRETDGQWN